MWIWYGGIFIGDVDNVVWDYDGEDLVDGVGGVGGIGIIVGVDGERCIGCIDWRFDFVVYVGCGV